MSTIAREERLDSAPAHRPRLIDLSRDRLGLPTAQHVREAAKRALDDGETHYTTRPGLNPLRRAIAAKLAQENQIQVDAEREVLVTCGTREALFVALHVLLERGDRAVVTGPSSPLYRSVARLAGGSARVVTGDPGDGFAVDPDAIDRGLTRRTRALVIVSPSSPAGSVADLPQLTALAELAILQSSRSRRSNHSSSMEQPRAASAHSLEWRSARSRSTDSPRRTAWPGGAWVTWPVPSRCLAR
jgi:aspartate/methionine/tyrosine aminotransferase